MPPNAPTNRKKPIINKKGIMLATIVMDPKIKKTCSNGLNNILEAFISRYFLVAK